MKKIPDIIVGKIRKTKTKLEKTANRTRLAPKPKTAVFKSDDRKTDAKVAAKSAKPKIPTPPS